MKKTINLGFTILEILVALAISSILMIAGAQLSDAKNQDITDQNTAQYHAMINNSAMKYIQSISDDIKTDAAVTLTSPRVINFNDIRVAGFIPNQFQNATTNPYGQTPCVFVYKDPANVNDIGALVVSEGGQDIKTGRITSIATLIGASGGYIHPSTPLQATGTYGKWSKAIPNLSCSGVKAAGNHIASQIYFDGSDLTQNYLYRSEVPGHPEANEMNTPLVMNAISTIDDDCTKIGSISRSSTGALLTCAGTVAPYKWRPSSSESAYWKDPVTTFAGLSALTCDASKAGETRTVRNPSAGSGSRAYTCNGTAWTALALDDAGNLSIPGTFTASRMNLGGATDVAASTANSIMVRVIATEGTSCPGGTASNGTIAKTATGTLLSCESGGWRKVAGNSAGGSFTIKYGAYGVCVHQPTECLAANSKTGGCSCASGFTAALSGRSSARCSAYEPGESTTDNYVCQ